MKKILMLFVLSVLLCNSSFANEVEYANQEMSINENKAVVMIQKQPTDEKSKQKQTVKNNWFCIVIQVNGKVMDSSLTK